MKLQRRTFTLACSATLLGGAPAMAQGNATLRWIVPYAAGGGSDVTARIIAETLKHELGETIVIDNKPGAGTIIGTQALVGSAPNGLTVSTADSGTLAFNPSLYAKLPYRLESSFAYVGGIGKMPMVLVTRPGLGAHSAQDLIALAKAQPGKLTYGSAGAGSPHHIAMELFQQQTGIRLSHVPYKGAAPAVQDLLGGQVDLMMLDIPGGIAHMRAGKLGLLGTALPARAKLLPEVPTLAEAGVPDFVAFAWQGMVAPAGTPPQRVQKLDAALFKALNSAPVRERLEQAGIEPMPMNAKEFTAYALAEQRRWAKVIQAAGVKLD